MVLKIETFSFLGLRSQIMLKRKIWHFFNIFFYLVPKKYLDFLLGKHTLIYWFAERCLASEALHIACIANVSKPRGCISTDAAGSRTCRSLKHHLLHPLILRLFVLCAPADFEAHSSLLWNRLHPQIQIPNPYPETASDSLSD